MDAAGIRSKVWSGLGRAAAKLGYPTRVYRPSGPLAPVVDGNWLTTIPAVFNSEDPKFIKPNKYGHSTWYGVFDGNQTRPGDILVSEDAGTFFIAAQQSLLNILVVQCNASVDVLRVPETTSAGLQGYGGVTAETEQPLMAGWPASILIGGKGEKNEAALPTDTRAGQYSILLPDVAGVMLRPSDIVRDNTSGRRYAVMSLELTDLGWRMTAREELA